MECCGEVKSATITAFSATLTIVAPAFSASEWVSGSKEHPIRHRLFDGRFRRGRISISWRVSSSRVPRLYVLIRGEGITSGSSSGATAPTSTTLARTMAGQQVPSLSPASPNVAAVVAEIPVLGGLHHEYRRAV
jgi:hypothetical protein